MNPVLFVCRGSVKDGLGHVMRCRTVISAFPSPENVLLAILGDSVVESLLTNVRFKYHIVAEEEELTSLARLYNPSLVVFDSIHIEEKTFESLSVGRVTASISPIFNMQARVDASYSRTKYEEQQDLLGDERHKRGLEYTTISDYCERIPVEVYASGLKERMLAVGVCMGGTDAANATLKILELLLEVKVPLLVWVMLGEGYAHSYQELVDCIRSDRRHEIVLAKAVQSMWRVLGRCSVAILAGGITTYEAAYAGLPSINTIPTEKQRFLVRELEEAGACFCIGADKADYPGRLCDILSDIDTNRDKLLTMHKRSKVLVDSLGAFRIAKDIYALLPQSPTTEGIRRL